MKTVFAKAIQPIRFLLPLLFLSGCSTPGWTFGRHRNTQPSVAAEMQRASLPQAQLMQQQGQYQAAIVEYRKVIEATSTKQEQTRARVGIATCLVKLGKYPVAVASLQPLPLPPESPCDRHTMAIAGEAMLRMKQYKEAESVLEIALTEIPMNGETPHPWVAGCSGNLGYAYLKNGKASKAALLYEQAATLYARQNNPLAAHKAQRMSDDIRTIIRQYAPYKPIPLTDDLPSGKH